MFQPNGLWLTADEKRLYVNDTDGAHFRAVDVQDDGSIVNGCWSPRESGRATWGSAACRRDELDERGNIYVTGPGGVCVFDPEGSQLGTIEVPENVGNINWGGPDWTWLFIAASTSIYRIKPACPETPFPT